MPGLLFIRAIDIFDIIDIALISYLIYKVIVFFKDTRAYQLLKGIVFLLIFSQASELLKLNTTSYILKNTLQVGLIAIIVLFQPEIRSTLSKMGSRRFLFLNPDGNNQEEEHDYIARQIREASFTLSKLGYGALIVIERDIKIGDIVRTGINLDSKVTSELLVNIFVPNTPLHDGAVIIGDNKIKAAGCFLPLSQNESISKALGTRHRAGIGISESTDAVVVIVSEETKKISVALGGNLTRNLSEDTLETMLKKAFSRELGKKNKKNIVWRFKKNEK